MLATAQSVMSGDCTRRAVEGFGRAQNPGDKALLGFVAAASVVGAAAGWVGGALLAGEVLAGVASVAEAAIAPAAQAISARIVAAGAAGVAGAAAEELSAACSFSADTPVATGDGEVAIGALKVGDPVLAYNQATQTTSSYTVTAILVHIDNIIAYLTVDGERLETTPEHPFLTIERGWMPAGQLQLGDHVRRANGMTGTIQTIQLVQQRQAMYNLTVAQAHTFFVGQGEWLVHNTCAPQLPNRNGVGPTTGHLFDSDGNMIGDPLVSGRNPYSSDPSLVRGDSNLYTIQDHVEAQAAGIMRDNNISNATLVINNHPCPGIFGCHSLLPRMLPEEATLRVIVPEGLDPRGAFDYTYRGVR